MDIRGGAGLVVAVALFFVVSLLGSCAPEVPAPDCQPRVNLRAQDAIVQAQGGRFVVDGVPLRVSGTNLYYALESVRQGEWEPVLEVMDQAAAVGMVSLRIWAFDLRPGTALHRADGSFDEEGLRALDRLMVEARRRGLRLILTLGNHWEDYGGLDAYAARVGAASRAEALGSEALRDLFAQWMEALATRTNHLTGVAYRDDPTLFSWELVNELRCEGEGCSEALTRDFLVDMAQRLRALDPRHMIGAGDEGWLFEAGMDARALARSGAFDWVSLHVWPHHHDRLLDAEGSGAWKESRAGAAGQARIASLASVARDAGLALVVGELGWPAQEGDEVERALILGAWLDEAQRQDAAAVFVWMLADARRPDYDGYVIRPSRDVATRAVLCHYAGGLGP